MRKSNSIRELLGIDVPIIQAPMGGVGTQDLAVAVSDAGGLGSMAFAGATQDSLRQSLQSVAQATSKSINFNFFAHERPVVSQADDDRWIDALTPYFNEFEIDIPEQLSNNGIEIFGADLCDVLLEHKPKIVSFHFGLPADEFISQLKNAGILIMSSATTVREAIYLETKGCDAIIAQGLEAGGHRGMFLSKDVSSQVGTMALVPQVVDAVGVPVIAAGGIADGRGISAAMALGASAVQMGTAFLRCTETALNNVYAQALDEAGPDDTALTNVISGRPTRIRSNRLVKDLGPLSADAPVFPRGFGVNSALRSVAEAKNSDEFSAHYCGQAVALGKPGSASKLVEEMWSDAINRSSQIRDALIS
ncbi:MAG: NAD(P)H-dependent flavin oxidoreductase [Hyphomicrobiales bacterium]